MIEQGASWVPSWTRSLDSAFAAFRKSEERSVASRSKYSMQALSDAQKRRFNCDNFVDQMGRGLAA